MQEYGAVVPERSTIAQSSSMVRHLWAFEGLVVTISDYRGTIAGLGVAVAPKNNFAGVYGDTQAGPHSVPQATLQAGPQAKTQAGTQVGPPLGRPSDVTNIICCA